MRRQEVLGFVFELHKDDILRVVFWDLLFFSLNTAFLRLSTAGPDVLHLFSLLLSFVGQHITMYLSVHSPDNECL